MTTQICRRHKTRDCSTCRTKSQREYGHDYSSVMWTSVAAGSSGPASFDDGPVHHSGSHRDDGGSSYDPSPSSSSGGYDSGSSSSSSSDSGGGGGD